MQEREIFDAALVLTNQEAQDDYVRRACGDDSAMRKHLLGLLQAQRKLGSFLEAGPAAENHTQVHTSQIQHPGETIGVRYKLLEQIGIGGMGAVWMAEQKEPVKRKVAIKLVKAGMDSAQVLARFEAERQALALMDHPNIAKVFDGGMTEQGRPYFVMEFVKGVPLTEYCDQAKLSLKERLNLFMPVCQAVQHAHQKGIIHRDLKPSNILICLYDGKPVPKVIDFGLAKAMHQSLTENTIHTAFGMMVGTPLYMSPEQAEHNNLDVDTRTDIYSLGVILYELLTGTTPLEQKQLKEAAYNEILRLIKEVEPPKPSTRLSGSASLPSIAAQRSIDPSQLKRSITGDLDWIVMKALDKERGRRYETANGLSRDVERFLNDEAVEACPPSTAYRLKKLIHRNRAMVTAVGAVVAALVLGILGFAWQANVATAQRVLAEKSRASEAEQRQLASDERDRAVEAQQQEAEQRKLAEAARIEAEHQKTKALEQEAEAKKQAAIAEAVAKFQTDMLAAVDPNQLPKDPVTKEPLKDAVTVLQAMEAAVKALDEGSLKDQPLVEAEVRQTIGNTLYQLGRNAEAEPNLRKSLLLLRTVHPAGHPYIATGLNNLALLLQAQNKSAEAEPLYREALEIWRATLPAGHPNIAKGLGNLARLLQDQNKLAEAEPLHREALEIMRGALPAGHPNIATSLNNLASLYWRQGKLDQSIPMFEEALRVIEKARGRRHPETLLTVANLGVNYKDAGRLAEAIPLLEEAYRASQIHASLRIFSVQLIDAYAKSGQMKKINDLIQEQLAEARKSLPQESAQLAEQLAQFGMTLLKLKAWEEAEPLIREALTIREKGEPDDWRTFNTKSMLGNVLLEQKKYAEAELLLLDGYKGMKDREAAIPPQGKVRIPESLERLVQLYTDWQAAEPDKGHDAKAIQWQTKLKVHQAATAAPPAAATPEPGK